MKTRKLETDRKNQEEHSELTEKERKQVGETKDSLMPRPSHGSGRGCVQRARLSLGGLSLNRKPIALRSIVAS